MRFRVFVPLATAAAFALVAAGSLQAAKVKAHPTYLALGDSVSFGYIAGDGYAYTRPTNFVGFPDYAGRALGLATTDAACPGETSGSFISTSTQDNGCQAYRSQFALHVRYAGSQLAYAVSYLKAHRDTKLVTIQLGANDGFILEAQCKLDPTCENAGLPAVLQSVGKNLGATIAALRATKYKGRIVLVNYYSLDYSDPLQTAFATAINQTFDAVAQATGAKVADAFSLFASAVASAGGSTCKAGLLNATPSSTLTGQLTCDVHPSQTGQQLIALAVEKAYRGK